MTVPAPIVIDAPFLQSMMLNPRKNTFVPTLTPRENMRMDVVIAIWENARRIFSRNSLIRKETHQHGVDFGSCIPMLFDTLNSCYD
jgi:hypothetical protein